MSTTAKIQLLLLGFVGLFFYGCIKTQSIPTIPAIAYKDFIKFAKDSADMLITFKDGDGDIGANTGDTMSPYGVNGQYYYNMIMIYYYKDIDGTYKRYHDPASKNPTDSFYVGYHIPFVTPTGQNKTLQGEIRARLNSPFYPVVGFQKPLHALIRFEVYIYDRALNKSNVVTTPDIKVP
jgi:hypothetical protein